MPSDSTFHAIEVFVQSGLLVSVLVLIWKASAVIQDFNHVKERQVEQIEDSEKQFDAIRETVAVVETSVARIEGRLNGWRKPVV